jgi:type II secretory pathway component PulF
MDDGMLRAIDNTIGFLRMTAVELRRIAERTPEVAEELRRIADKLDADANDLTGQMAGLPRPARR